MKARRRRRALAGGMKAFRRNMRLHRLLSAAASLKLMQRKPLGLIHAYAWTGNQDYLWFVQCWWRWRQWTLGRIQLKAFIATHFRGLQRIWLELTWKAWRLYAQARVSDGVHPLGCTVARPACPRHRHV